VDLSVAAPALDELCAAVAAARVVVPVGARTQWEVGGAPYGGDGATEVRAPRGVVAYDPADLTVTVGAGTPVRDLEATLAEQGQECGLDPRDGAATVGGVLACGLSGTRRLRYGPVRDTVLEVRFVTGDGRVVKGGGPTVKNVTGYDLPRLLVGSFGTLGVIAQVTLRCRPRAQARAWGSSSSAPAGIAGTAFRPSSLLWDGRATWVLVEGVAADVEREVRSCGVDPVERGPELPAGAHRGRISVAPGALADVGGALERIEGVRWLAEWRVGTVHVACDDADGLRAARAAAHAAGGWMLREAGGGDGFDGFGVELPNRELHRRIKDSFDPGGKCNPGRLP
jgi:glycolate oxidase FAD binding subunit